MSRPRPGRKSSGWRRVDQGEEMGSGGGRSDKGGERERPSGRKQRDRGGRNTRRQAQTPWDDGTSQAYHCDLVPERAQGGGTPTRQGTHRMGRGRAAMCPGTSLPRRTYVSGRSTGTGFTGTRAHISTAASKTTRRGKRGGLTLRSCHRGAMARQAGSSDNGSWGRCG